MQAADVIGGKTEILAGKKSDRKSLVFSVNWPVSSLGGVNEVVLNLAHQFEMLSNYHPVIVVTTWDSAVQPKHFRGNEVVNLRLREPLGSGGLRQFLAFLRTLPVDAWNCLRFIRERQVEVWNAHYPGTNIYLLLLLKWMGLFKGRIILSFHGSDFRAMDGLKGFQRTAWRTAFTQADAVVACSLDLAGLIQSFEPGARIVTIHNGVNEAMFNCERMVRRARRSILHVGKYDLNKSQDVLLRAFHLLLKKIPDASLVLVGSNGSALQQFRDLVCELGLERQVEIHVDVPHEELPRIMSQADLFVLPSRKEALPLVLLEAGAANLPVVASRTGGIPELIEDGVNGLLVAPGDVQALEAAMRDLLLNTDEADRLSQTWHAQVLTMWSWEYTAQRYLEVLERPTETQAPIRN